MQRRVRARRSEGVFIPPFNLDRRCLERLLDRRRLALVESRRSERLLDRRRLALVESRRSERVLDRRRLEPRVRRGERRGERLVRFLKFVPRSIGRLRGR